MTKDIIFTLPAEAVEEATEVLLLGDFNNWDPEKGIKLEKQEDGSLKAVAALEGGKTYQYRFLLNNGQWVNDYHAQNYVPVSGFHIDNCVIIVPGALDIEENQKAEAEPVTQEAVNQEPPNQEPKNHQPENQELANNEPVSNESAKAETPVNQETDVTPEPIKAKTSKAKTTKAKTAKSATEKAKAEKAEKPAKAEKKEATKKKK